MTHELSDEELEQLAIGVVLAYMDILGPRILQRRKAVAHAALNALGQVKQSSVPSDLVASIRQKMNTSKARNLELDSYDFGELWDEAVRYADEQIAAGMPSDDVWGKIFAAAEERLME